MSDFNPSAMRRPWVIATLLLASIMILFAGRAANAHGSSAGPVDIDHPYATPTPPGARTGAVYFRALRNTGRQADRLIGASTPVAARVEIHESVIDSGGVMRMREIEAIDLAPRSSLKPRHTGHLHLMLIDLKAPLVNGERFPMRLRFERNGEVEVTVWVQQPKAGAAPGHRH